MWKCLECEVECCEFVCVFCGDCVCKYCGGGGCMWLLGKVIVCFFMCCMVGCLWVSGPACAWGERFCICCMASCVVLILYWEFCFSCVVMVIELPCIFCVCCDVVVVCVCCSCR